MATNSPAPGLPQVDLLNAKLADLQSCLRPVDEESVPIGQALGRVLSREIKAFRDSPSINVSAMDGYAIRRHDLDGRVLPICATTAAGSPPALLSAGAAVRIFTGGAVPSGADCVIRREDCNESESYVSINLSKDSIPHGLNIRSQGENARRGDTVVGPGVLLDACKYAGAVTFSDQPDLFVYRKLRVAIINTGDELVKFGQPMEPWQIRDSNGPFLEAMFANYAWADVQRSQVKDQAQDAHLAIQDRLRHCDVLLLTGGISMGDTDHVPDAIRNAGCRILFHKIPIRPGRPMLGAVGPCGQLVLGLPGNPLSVAVTFRRFGLGLIQVMAGICTITPSTHRTLHCDDPKTLDLTWFRLVRSNADGSLSLVPNQGSGDIASLVQSDGFVEISPNSYSAGTWPFFAW
jgi:molybdopterin molybdotransferase